MASFLPTQEPGPGPTDAPLPTYQSYSAYTTSTYQQTLTLTRIAYDPQATAAPSVDIETVTQLTTSVGYSVVNIPLLYDGPLPPPPLGTLFTTANQRVIAPTATSTAQQPGSTGGNGQGQSGGSGGSSQSGGSGTGNGSGNGSGSGSGSGNGSSSGSGGSNGGSGTNSGNNGSGSGGSNAGGQSSGGSNNSGGSDTGSSNGDEGQSGGSNSGTSGGQNGAGNGSNGGQTGSGSQGGQNGTSASTILPLPTAAASSASAASVAASSAAASASAASVAASNAAESSAASLASVSAASQASQASQASASAATATMTGTSTNGQASSSSPSSTQTAGGGLPPKSDLARNGLSGGQIAGIVIGVLAALLLALLCLLCAARRRRRRRKEAAAAGLTGGSGAGILGVSSAMRKSGSRRWKPAFGRVEGANRRGAYAALGAAGAGAALGAGAAADRGSVRSDEWEADHLGSHGSGFFVVGGKQGQTDPFGDEAAADNYNYQYGNVAPSASSSGAHAKKDLLGAGGIAALGAGLAAVFAGKSRKSSGQDKGKGRLIDSNSASGHHADASFAGDDEDGSAERRGLMNFVDADNTADMTAAGDLSEMRESGPGRWSAPVSYDPYRSSTGVGVAAAGTAAAAAYYATSPRQDDHDQQGRESALSPSAPTYAGWTRYSDSATGGAASSAAIGGADEPSITASSSGSNSNANRPSSHSTGRRTNESLYTTIGAFPRIEEPIAEGADGRDAGGKDDIQTYGNMAPSSKARIGTFGESPREPEGKELRSAADSYRDLSYLSDDPEEQRRLALAAAAATVAAGGGLGLGALAAHHRHSTVDPAGNGGQDQRTSRFISRDTPLLGPGFDGQNANQAQRADPNINAAEQEEFESMLPAFAASHGRTDSYGPHGRLSTIQSVGEFGERGSSSGGGGGGGATGGGATSGGGMTGSSAQQSSSSSEAARLRASQAFGRPASSINTMGAVTADESIRHSGEQNPLDGVDDDNEAAQSSNQQHLGHSSGEVTAAGVVGGAGLLGSLAFGWRKLTGSAPSSSAAGATDMQRDDSQDAEAAASGLMNLRDSGASSHAHHREPHARQRSRGDPGMAVEVQSQRASVITATNHGHDSGNGLRASSSSGNGSGERRSPSGSGHSQSSQKPTTIREEAEEQRVHAHVPQEEADDDNGNMADDEDPIGDSSGAVATVGTTRGGAPTSTTAASVAQTRSSSDNPYDVATRTATSPTGETSTRAIRDAISEEAAVDTGVSRAGDSESYTTSPQRPSREDGSVESRSMNSSERYRQKLAARHASSGASTGAASYSPSHLVRHSSGAAATTSSNSMSSSRGARGGASRGGLARAAYESSDYTSSNSRNKSTASRRDTSTLESDGQSSRATAGGVQDEIRRFSMDQASLGRLHEQQEDFNDDRDNSSPYNFDAGSPTSPFYPSESLGAAVRRRAEQDAARDEKQRERNDSIATSADQTVTPRVIPMALRVGAGSAAAAATTTATSNVGSGSGSGGASSGTTAIMQASDSPANNASQWRQSPRVETASQRAVQAAASFDEQNQRRQSQLRRSGGGGEQVARDLEAGRDDDTNEKRDESQRDVEDESDEEDENGAKRKSVWPKFLRR